MLLIYQRGENMNNSENAIKEIKETLHQYAEFVNSGDLEGWISLWTKDGVQMPSDLPSLVGAEQIKKRMKPLLEEMSTDLTILDIEDVRVYGNLGVTRCTYTISVSPLSGGDKMVIVPDGKALTLYQRQSDNSWKIIYDCVNSNVPIK